MLSNLFLSESMFRYLIAILFLCFLFKQRVAKKQSDSTGDMFKLT